MADGSFASAIRPLSRSNMFPAPERGTEGSDRQCRGTIPFGGQPQCTVTTKYRSQGVETHAHWTCSSANNHVASIESKRGWGAGYSRPEETSISHACGSTAQPQPYQNTVTVRLHRSPPRNPNGNSEAVMDQQHYTVIHHTLRPAGLSATRKAWT